MASAEVGEPLWLTLTARLIAPPSLHCRTTLQVDP